MNETLKRRNTRWKASVVLLSSLLFFLLNWLPVTAQAAYPSRVLHEAAPTVIQSTPTVDPTITTLNKQKLENETSWWWNNMAPLITSLVTILSLLGGGIFTVVRVTREQRANRERLNEEHDQRLEDRKAEREKRDEEQKRWLEDRKAEREKRDEEQKRLLVERESEREKQGEARFQAVVEGLGSSNQAAQVGAAITLRTFLRPGYEQFYRQVFDLAIAHLRLRTVDPNTPTSELLDSLSQALITIFKESFPLSRGQLGDITNIQQLDASHVKLDHAYLAHADLQHIWMPNAYLSKADLGGANLSKADLGRATLTEASLTGADLMGADLTLANLSRAYLSKADFRGATLTGATLTEANLRGTDFRGADLTGADLILAYLILANLREANLSEATLRKATLSEADLREADLSKADLREADLSKADLTGANLSGANLSGANLSEAALQIVRAWTGTKLLNIQGLTPSQLAEFQAKGAIIEEEKNKDEQSM